MQKVADHVKLFLATLWDALDHSMEEINLAMEDSLRVLNMNSMYFDEFRKLTDVDEKFVQ